MASTTSHNKQPRMVGEKMVVYLPAPLPFKCPICKPNKEKERGWLATSDLQKAFKMHHDRYHRAVKVSMVCSRCSAAVASFGDMQAHEQNCGHRRSGGGTTRRPSAGDTTGPVNRRSDSRPTAAATTSSSSRASANTTKGPPGQTRTSGSGLGRKSVERPVSQPAGDRRSGQQVQPQRPPTRAPAKPAVSQPTTRGATKPQAPKRTSRGPSQPSSPMMTSTVRPSPTKATQPVTRPTPRSRSSLSESVEEQQHQLSGAATTSQTVASPHTSRLSDIGEDTINQLRTQDNNISHEERPTNNTSQEAPSQIPPSPAREVEITSSDSSMESLTESSLNDSEWIPHHTTTNNGRRRLSTSSLDSSVSSLPSTRGHPTQSTATRGDSQTPSQDCPSEGSTPPSSPEVDRQTPSPDHFGRQIHPEFKEGTLYVYYPLPTEMEPFESLKCRDCYDPHRFGRDGACEGSYTTLPNARRHFQTSSVHWGSKEKMPEIHICRICGFTVPASSKQMPKVARSHLTRAHQIGLNGQTVEARLLEIQGGTALRNHRRREQQQHPRQTTPQAGTTTSVDQNGPGTSGTSSQVDVPNNTQNTQPHHNNNNNNNRQNNRPRHNTNNSNNNNRPRHNNNNRNNNRTGHNPPPGRPRLVQGTVSNETGQRGNRPETDPTAEARSTEALPPRTEQQSSRRGPSEEQTELMTAIGEVTSAPMLEELTPRVSTFLGRFTLRREGGGNRERPPANNVANQGGGGRQREDQGRVAAATRIQKLYRKNRRKAVQQVLNGPTLQCKIEKRTIQDHFQHVHAERPSGEELPHDFGQDPPTDESNARLAAPFSRSEVSKRLWKMSNTSPGPDGIAYIDLRRADPGCHVLTALYNKVQELNYTPKEWKNSNTILLHKKGDESDISNWRPISMGDTTPKLFAAILADRLTAWSLANGRLSPSQKGFLHYEGCFEHNFVLQEALREGASTRREVVVAWLDLTNAFPSVPHSSIHRALEAHGVPQSTRNIIKSLYEGVQTRVRTADGYTDPINIRSGVRQGCPLSPIVFNLALEPVLRAIEATGHGARVRGRRVSNLAYADDVAILADSVEGMQEILRTTEDAARLVGLTFNPRKCATLHQLGRGEDAVLPTAFVLQGQRIRALGPGEPYEHLGIPTGNQVRQTPDEAIRAAEADIERINGSWLAPWQKLEAVATFILPRFDFSLQGAEIRKEPFNKIDKKIMKAAKAWMGLTQRSSCEVVFLPPSRGGGGLLPLADMADLLTVARAFKMLTCRDATVSGIAMDSLLDATSIRLSRPATAEDCARYLSSDPTLTMKRSSTTSTYWSVARAATSRLKSAKKNLDLEWGWSESRREHSLRCRGPGARPVITTPESRSQLVHRLRTALQSHYLERLLAKPDQGKAYHQITRSREANHFLRTGSFTRFCDWRFVHRARLNCLPLNATMRWRDGDKTCRKCGAQQETLPHVIGHCGVHAAAVQLRHNNIQDRLAKAAKVAGTITINRTIPGADGELAELRPDIVVKDDVKKRMIIVDVTVPFENGPAAFDEARGRKLEKYQPLAESFRGRGYEVVVDAFVIGALGGWDRRNEKTLRLLNINRRYAVMMRRLMVSDTIRWSRDIYVEHVSGQRQYTLENQ